MKTVTIWSCCILLCILSCFVTAQEEKCSDQTAPSGYEWISSGMENNLCYDIHLKARYGAECEVQGQQDEDGSSSSSSSSGRNHGGIASSKSRRKKRDDDQAGDDRNRDSTGNFDDQCIKDICCQGELVYALVNTSCLCPSKVTNTEPGSPNTVPNTVNYPATTTTDDGITEATTTEGTTTEAMTEATTTEGTTTEAMTTVTFTEGTTTIEITTTETMTTFPLAVLEQAAANGPGKEDVAISKVDGVEKPGIQGDWRDKDESNDESSDSESDSEEDENDEKDANEVSETEIDSSGNYSTTDIGEDAGGTQVLGEGDRCDGRSVYTDDNGESGEDESSDSKSDSSSDSSESSSTGVAKVCQEGLICTPIGGGKRECRPSTTGQPVVTTIGITFGPAIAQNNAPEGQNAAVNFVSGVPGSSSFTLSGLKLLFLTVFAAILLY